MRVWARITMPTLDRSASPSSLEQSLVISYLTLRTAVGVLGLALPVILLFGGLIFSDCHCVEPSISAYYYTPLRNVFVGLLFALGLFFFSYNGYERDRIAGDLAFVCAIGVALCPSESGGFVTALHYIFAGTLFLTLAFFSLFLFTKSDTDQPTPKKRARNVMYRVTGVLMVVFVLLILVFKLARLDERWAAYKPIFDLEFLLLWAFGLSWLTKGEAILGDLSSEASPPDADAFAKSWIEGWNSHDLDRILPHYAEALDFRSPLIRDRYPGSSGVIRNRAKLREYFAKGLERTPNLSFKLLEVLRGVSGICLYYENARGGHTAEYMELDAHGRIVRVINCYSNP
jgi:hypothetical protein